MGGGKRNSLEDLVQLIAFMPWWACVGLGVVGYVGLHPFATSTLPVVTGMQQMPSLMVTAVAKGMATVGQCVWPRACAGRCGDLSARSSKRQDG
jgi:restriction system protein